MISTSNFPFLSGGNCRILTTTRDLVGLGVDATAIHKVIRINATKAVNAGILTERGPWLQEVGCREVVEHTKIVSIFAKTKVKVKIRKGGWA